MNVYTAEFHGVWLGGEALILAPNVVDARQMLEEELTRRSLEQQRSPPDITWHAVAVAGTLAKVVILNDGDY